MLAAEIGTKPGALFTIRSPVVARGQHVREKDAVCPATPLRARFLVRTIVIYVLGCAIRFR